MSSNLVPASVARPASTGSCPCGCFARRPRYPSDLTDPEWAVLEPQLPTPAWQLPCGGRPERHHRRSMIDAILYLVDNGIRWRALPADFPPWATVYSFFTRWADNLTLIAVTDRLRQALRMALGRNPTPTAAVIDSQSVKESADAVVPATTSGFDPFKHVNGRKRHITVDTLGLLCGVVVTAANIRDQHPARPLLADATRHGIRHIWADQGYHVQTLITHARREYGITLAIVRRPEGRKGFHVLTRRWVVERTFAWITRRRRCARDYERLPDHHEAMVHWAAILTMTRRQARHHNPHPKV